MTYEKDASSPQNGRSLETRPNQLAGFALLFLTGFLLSLLMPGLFGQAAGQVPASAELWKELRGLGNSATAVHVTAHPDDEDGPLLTWLSRGQGVRTILFTMNRGEGGANLISDLQEDRLGVLRTLEMSLAARDYGISNVFNHLADYGFSKRVEEALEKWGGAESVVEDLVRVIRQERPDVLIGRFRDDPRDGGGHATAHLVGLACKLAFQMAGSPERFPAQIEQGLRPWQPAKLYLHSSRPDQPSPPSAATVTVEAGAYDPLLGSSYFEFSRRGLHRHRTQGMGARPSLPGPFAIRYERIASRLEGDSRDSERSFFDGLDTSLAGMPARFLPSEQRESWLEEELRVVQELGNDARAQFEARVPDRIAPLLARALEKGRALEKRIGLGDGPGFMEILFRLRHEVERLERALIQSAGLELQAIVLPPGVAGTRQEFRPPSTPLYTTPGSLLPVSLQLQRRSASSVRVLAFGFEAPAGWKVPQETAQLRPAALASGMKLQTSIEVSPQAEPDCPYWSRSSPRETVHTTSKPALGTLPLPAPPVWGRALLEIEGVPVELRTPLLTRQLDHRAGLVTSPLRVAPRISLRFPAARELYRLDQRSRTVSVLVTAHQEQLGRVVVQLEAPGGWQVEPNVASVQFERMDQEETVTFEVTPPSDLSPAQYTFSALARHDGNEYRRSFEPIRATPDSEAFPYCEDSRLEFQVADVRLLRDLRVGYVAGSGDYIPQALEQLGLSVALLDAAQLSSNSLQSFHTIIVGVRAYASRPDLIAQNQKLLEFVRQGGTMLVLYQTPEFDHNFGPYPYGMGNSPEEVTEESAPVVILDPDHPLWSGPNRISGIDFESWIGERGSKFLTSWDSGYEPLLETHDTNQAPQQGGLLVAAHGEGAYIYCAYALHRQLPQAVPGAFRIFANLLSLGHGQEPR